MLDDTLLAINQVTLREQWSLAQAIEGLARHGVHGIAVWRDKLRELGVAEGARRLRDHGMTVTGYCVGGLLTARDDAAFQAALDDNRRVIEEAAEIGARCVIVLSGGLEAGERDLAFARARALDGLAELLPAAEAAGVTLALEPLHPMMCAQRSVLATLGQANDWCERLGAGAALGIAVDVYHVWWDPDLAAQIRRAGLRIVSYRDWLPETRDLRLDRGMMGDGVIDLPGIRRLVEAAATVAIARSRSSDRDWWRRDPTDHRAR